MTKRSRDWNEGLAEDLQDPEFARQFLTAAVEEGVPLKLALAKVIRATGVKEFSETVGMPSPNVLRAIEAANARGLVTIALTGRGGAAGKIAAHHVGVDEDRTPRVQEVHATLLHVMCELLEMELKS